MARPRPDQPDSADGIEKPAGAYHHGDLRRALIDAALEHIEREGPKELSLRAVARRAGVSSAAPYRHFASRDALLAAVAEEGFQTLADGIRKAAAAFPDDPLARLRESGVAYVLFAAAHPAHYSVMWAPGLFEQTAHPSFRAAANDALSLLFEAITDCQRAGLARPDPPAELAMVAWSGVHGLASLISNGQLKALGLASKDVEALARYLSLALLSGVRTNG